MRPTGKLHLGHYVGALQNWVRLQDDYECFFFIADWHALTTDYADTSQRQAELARGACSTGSPPASIPSAARCSSSRTCRSTPNCTCCSRMITPLGWLERVPTYKEQRENIKDKDLSTYGFLGYPLLQSADILIYQADFVPVGEDQVAARRTHARDRAALQPVLSAQSC